MNRSRAQRGFLLAFVLLGALAALVWAVGRYGHVSIGPGIVHWLWRLSVLAYAGYAVTRRSLTAWIILGMLIGAEIGYDLKYFDDATRSRYADNIQVLSGIFLKQIGRAHV